MDFDFNDEQRMLKDSVDRLVADKYGFEQRKRYAAEERGYAADIWAQFAELGLLALPFDESLGGFGGGPVETMIVAEALGRALALEPYLATVVLGGGFLRHGGNDAQKAALIPRIAQGDLTLAFAHTERRSRYDLNAVTTTARADGDGWIIDGEKGVVGHGDSADILIVTARTAGGARDAKGIGVFLVDAASAGLSRRGYVTQDGTRAAEVTFAKVRVGPEHVIGDPADGLALVERVVDEARAALCAEAVGAMQAVHELTIDYLKTRKQFGINIGAFQALQHRGADMFVALEQARSMAMFAAMSVQETDPARRAADVAAAKIQIGRSAKLIGQQAVQLHGGIGMTMEYQAGHYFKRLTMIDSQFGDADYHLGRLAGDGGLMR